MIAPAIQFAIAKRDAVRVFVERLIERLQRNRYAIDEGTDPGDARYRQGWNDALAHVQRDLLGS